MSPIALSVLTIDYSLPYPRKGFRVRELAALRAATKGAGMDRGCVIRRLSFVLVVVALATGALVDNADARLYRRSRNVTGANFFDVRVCRDGIEFVLGRQRGEALEPGDPAGTVDQTVLLFRADGSLVLDFGAAEIRVVPPPYTIYSEPWDPLRLPLGPVWAMRTTQPWGVGGSQIKLRPGEELTGIFPLELDGEDGPFAEGGEDDPKIVVKRCKVFKPVKAKVDVRPGVSPNSVTPGSSAPVSFAMLSKGKFNASLVDAATVRIGSAAATGASLSDVDGDGDRDFVASFSPAAAGIACGLKRVNVTANAGYGPAITGRGSIKTTC